MKVVVTGGTGFVGSHLVEALLARGDDVTCLVRSPAKLARLFPTQPPLAVRGDLFDERALREALQGAQVVFHVAGITAARSRREFFDINTGGTERLIAALDDTGGSLRRLVHVSSLSAAGPTTRGRPIDEESTPRPVSAYGASKLAGEEAVRRSSLPWTMVRPPSVYGPRDTEFLRVFKLVRWGVVPLAGDPDQELSFVHVRDLVEALLAAAERGRPHGTYHAAHPTVLTAREFIGHVHRATAAASGRDPTHAPRIVPLPAWLARATLTLTHAAARVAGRATLLSPDKASELFAAAWTCSPAALQRDTGWRAARTHEEGLGDTARWYQEHQWL